MLPNLLPILSGGRAASLAAYIGGTTQAGDATTYTFANQALGPSAPRRYSLISVQSAGVAGRTISSIKVNGITPTQIGALLNSGNAYVAFYIIPTAGPAGNIVITWSGGMSRCRVDVWSILGLRSVVPTDVQTDTTVTANAVSVALNVSKDGCAFAIVSDFNASANTKAWVGLAEVFDAVLESTHYGTVAFANFAAAQSGLTISATASAGTMLTPAMLAISLR